MKRRRLIQWLTQRHFGEPLVDYKGVQLIAVYLMIGLLLYFAPL